MLPYREVETSHGRSISPELEKGKQEDKVFKTSLDYIILCLKEKKEKKGKEKNKPKQIKNMSPGNLHRHTKQK